MPRLQIAAGLTADRNRPRGNSRVIRLYWLCNRDITTPVETCARCGKPLRRVRRKLFQQLRYSAAFQCRECQSEEYAPRRYRFHFGDRARCPLCGTVRIEKLKKRDPIDPMHWSFLIVLERLLFGKLYHCNFCRIQFYDRRDRAPDASRSA